MCGGSVARSSRGSVGRPGQAGSSGSGSGKRRSVSRLARRSLVAATSVGASSRASRRPSWPWSSSPSAASSASSSARSACRAMPTGPFAASARRRSTLHDRRHRGGAAGTSDRPVPRRARPSRRPVRRRPRARDGPTGRHAGRPGSRQTGRMWPPFRSVLFTTASNRAIRRNRRSEVRTRSQEWTAGSVSIQSLDHARSEWAVAQHRRRDDPPAARVRDKGGGDLPAGQRPVGKVPQGPLEPDWLVDRGHPVASRPEGAVQGRVRGPRAGPGPRARRVRSSSRAARRSSPGSPGRLIRVSSGRRWAGADVALRIERLAAPRAERPTAGDHPGSLGHEGPDLGRR